MPKLLLCALALCLSLPIAVNAETLTSGVDVSHDQGPVDWAKVKGAGVDWAYAKASEGDTLGDATFAANWPAIKAAGLTRGAYHFYVVGDPPKDQLANFTKHVTLEPGDLPPMVDVERKQHPQGRTAMIADLHEFLSLLKAHYGVTPIVYTEPAFWNANFDGSFSDYPLWVAEYGVRAPRPVTGWTGWTIWQHSESGKVLGINTPVDLDHFKGTLQDLKKLAVPGG